jgi:hypothetical protein
MIEAINRHPRYDHAGMVIDTSTHAIAFVAAVQQGHDIARSLALRFTPPRTIRERFPSHPVMIRA